MQAFSQVLSKILLIDLELSTSKTDFFEVVFQNILLINFISTNLKTGLSKTFSRKILFIDSKTSTTTITHLKVHEQKNTLILWF